MVKYLDDILMIVGIACLTTAGFLMHRAAGWAVLGTGLIALAVVVARGGMNNAAR